MSVRSAGLLVMTVALMVAFLAAELTLGVRVAVLAGAGASYVVLITQRLSSSWVLGAFLVVAIVAVAEEPQGTDLWSYQAHGRILVVYRDDPYDAVPADYPHDPVMRRVPDFYQGSVSPYGPLFGGVAAGIAAATGESELAGRLAWQLLGAAAMLGCVALLWRRVSGRAMAAFLLNPIVAYELVHLAHNDALIGLGVLAGCLLAHAGRTTWAALALAAAALVKVPVGIALVVLVCWLLSQRRVREAGRAVLAAGGLGIGLLLAAGGARVLDPLTRSRGVTNATSVWNAARGDWETLLWRPLRGVPGTSGALVSTLAIAIPIALAVWVAIRSAARPLVQPTTIALLAWLVLALYPSTWYYGWILPLVALWALRERVLLGGLAALYAVTTQAWLLPLAAQLTGDGRLGLADRVGAPLLGLSVLAGLGLLVHLVVTTSRAPGQSQVVLSRRG